MMIYHGIEDFVSLPYAVVTSGTFDGVHKGHQKILQKLKETAVANNGETVVITFWPHPRMVLYPEQTDLKLLNTFEEKAELLRANGVQHLVRIPFTKEFSQLSSHEFIQKVLVQKIGTKKLVIGYDHRFGKNREGSFEALIEDAPKYGFEVQEIPRQDIDHITISSTNIRKALREGDMQSANELLGMPYSLQGRVIKGDRLGRLMGFPTANIEVEFKYKLIPAEGVYAVSTAYNGQRYKGMLYIGYRPTVGGIKKNIEVNIFDFDKDIYGENLKINFHTLIRHDVKFNDLEALRLQLQKDKVASVEVLKQFD
jgi:riboflavin kinase / FMN adenylyltransferase